MYQLRIQEKLKLIKNKNRNEKSVKYENKTRDNPKDGD